MRQSLRRSDNPAEATIGRDMWLKSGGLIEAHPRFEVTWVRGRLPLLELFPTCSHHT